MRTIINRLITIICISVIVVSGILYFARVTDRRDDDYKYAPFFKEDTDYDALFFGTSHVIYGIYPMNLWEQYGLTSYNFGGHGNSLAVSYWQFKNAIEYHKPKIAVLDVCGAYRDNNDMVYSFEQAHISLDAFPLTRTKINGIKDSFPEKGEQLELMFPFSSYHARWSELNGNAYLAPFVKEQVTKEKGAESEAGVFTGGYEEASVSREEGWKEHTVSMDYIERFVDDCRAEEIEPLLIFLPDPAGKEARLGANSVYQIAEDKEVPFINFTYDGNVTDPDTDFFDPESHLNMLGAGKITEYLGKYLTENYELKDKREDPAYTGWKEDAVTFLELMLEKASEQEELSGLLSMLYSPYYTSELSVPEEYEFSETERAVLSDLEGEGMLKVDRVPAGDLGESEYYLDIKSGKDGEVLLRIEK